MSLAPPVQNRADVVERIASLREAITSLGVAGLLLFGSFARDEAGADSDVDLLVEYAPGAKGFAAFMALADLLEATLGRRVDLVTVESVSPYLRERVFGEARHVLGAA